MIRALVALPDECLSGRWTCAGQERLGEGRWIVVVAMQLAKKKDGQIGDMRERSEVACSSSSAAPAGGSQ